MSTAVSSKRASTGVSEKQARREIANYNERRRMKSINDGFESLKELLPVDGEKTSKAAILQHANEYISYLLKREKALRKENDMLRAGMTVAVNMDSSSARAQPYLAMGISGYHETPSPARHRVISMPGATVPSSTYATIRTQIESPIISVQPAVTPSPTRRRRSSPTPTNKKLTSNAGKKSSTASSNRSLEVMLAAIDTLERTETKPVTTLRAKTPTDEFDSNPVTPEATAQPRVLHWPTSVSPKCSASIYDRPIKGMKATRRLELGTC